MTDQAWRPRFSDGLYRHFPTAFVDRPTNDEIDRAFEDMDGVPDVEGVEFFGDTTVTLENAAHVRRRLDERGLVCANVYPAEPSVRGTFAQALFTAGEESERRAAIELSMRAVEVARALGGNRVYLFTALDGADYPFQQDYRSARKYTVEALQEICERAGEVNMALECRPHTPKGWTNIGSIAASLDLITEVARPNLGVQLEIAHTILAGENLGQMAWETGRRGLLYHVHLNDTKPPIDVGTVFGSHHFWECLEFLYWLREVNYSNFLGIDAFWFREDARQNAVQLVRNVQFMVRVLDALDRDRLAQAMAAQDINASQALLWAALRGTS